jgi:predicted PolB exonuclease-like 3'-5' exonuclease
VLDICGKKPWEVRHLDTLEMWKFGDRKNYTSLELLAAVLGIASSKDSVDGSMVNMVYYKEKDIQKIAKYCEKDVIVTAQVYLKLTGKGILKNENVHLISSIV